MRSENGIEVDMTALAELLQRADVITVGFTLFPERILVDTRSNDRQGQCAVTVEPVGTVQERYLWLGANRSSFGAPEAFSFFVWPHTVRSLLEREALAPLRARLEAETAVALDATLAEALQREQSEMIAAVRGSERWPTLWERGGKRADR